LFQTLSDTVTPLGPREVRSAEELITYLKGEYITFPDAEETVLDLVAEGESVAVRSHFRGTQVGSMGSYPPSNKVLFATYLAIYRLENKRIAEAWWNGTTCMGSNNWAITMQRNLRRRDSRPFERG
jgi:predicted ester cyclase